ncbi:MAG: response regulator [Salinisphaeraceae bacterium]|nr:response regulator [Salinisphaeraceae bacterium]
MSIKQTSFGLKVAIGALLVYVLVTALRLPSSDFTARSDALAELEFNLELKASFKADIIETALQTLRSDVSLLANTPPIMGIVRASRNSGKDPRDNSDLDVWKNRLGTIFSAYLESHPQAYQVRYIGVANRGREIVRVERIGERIVRAEEAALQTKGERGYYIATLSRGPGEVVLTEISYNRERGLLQKPYVPTQRASVPIYDNEGKAFGMVVINYDVGPLLKAVEETESDGIETYLLNGSGQYLLHPKPGVGFGFETGNPRSWNEDFTLKSDSDLDGLLRYSSPEGEKLAIRKRLNFNPGTQGNTLTLAMVADSNLIESAVVQARNRVIIALLSTFAVVSLFLFLMVQTLKRKEEANLRASELASIVSHTRDAIIGQTVKGVVTSWNPAAEKLFGFSEEEAVGRSMDELITPQSHLSEEAEIRKKIQAGESVDLMETIRLHKDGYPIDVSVSVSPIRTASREITGASVLIKDITEQKRARAQIIELNESLERKVAERTQELQVAKKSAEAASQAKTEFLASMSHEIRTPMNAILGMMQLLERTQLNSHQADYLDKAQSSAKALLSIINDILDYSKIEAGKLDLDPQPFLMDRVLRDLSMMLGTSIGDKNVEMLFKVDANVPQHLLGDSLRLKQILVNLAGNAIKFTEEGEVVIEVSLQEQHGDEVALAFKVRDTGIGISEEQQKNIFQAFRQADAGTTRRYGGTGLGLVISQRLIRLMGGELELESELGKGSIFSFTSRMQALAEEDAPDTVATQIQQRPELGQLRVLVADDNASARRILSRLAQSLGWHCDLADDGETAVRLIRKALDEGRPYKAAFIDWKMPGMNGWETSKAIHELEEGKLLPLIVMVTAHAREMLANHMAEEKELIDGFLVKPVTASDLMDAVAEVIGGEALKPISGDGHIQSDQRLQDMRILVVEDNPTNQQVAQRLLEFEGAEVTIAGGGLTALDILQQADSQFDAVLMDIQMPDLDGYETTRRIRLKLGMTDLPIIAMTANVMKSDQEAALAAGMNEHVGKPFELNKVVNALLRNTGREVVESRQPAGPAQDPNSDLPTNTGGIALKAALERLGNDRALYARQARRFGEAHGQDASQVEELLQAEAYEDAARMLHTLKGVAATLGSDQLAKLCKDMELAVKEGSDTIDFERLEQEINMTARALTKLADTLQPKASKGQSTEELKPKLKELETLLSASNMQATTLYSDLRPMLDNIEATELTRLDTAMDNLAFSDAKQIVQSLLEK